MTFHGATFAGAVSACAIAFGCGGGGDRQVTGPGDDPGGDDPSLVVSVGVDPADAALAESLGWTAGVPGAEVRLNRNGTASWETRTTDPSGRVVFEDFLPGRYRIYAERRLTAGDAAASGGAIRAFGDGRIFDFPETATLDLTLYADSPGGLVISEKSTVAPPPWETNGQYVDGYYFEIYNNSDQTAYLDGLVFGPAYRGDRDTDHTPCSVSQPVRDDDTAIHGRGFLQFPGSGAEYPILPGEAKVVAQAAIDHTPVHPLLLDLRDADFEIRERGLLGGHADNPAVPDMLHVGLETWQATWLLGTRLFHLSEPLDPHALPIAFRDAQGRAYVRVPAETVLDAAAFQVLWPDSDIEAPPCIPMFPRAFDRFPGGLYEIGFGVASPTESLHRLVLRHEGGRAILQNANTSAIDFALGRQTPGWVEER